MRITSLTLAAALLLVAQLARAQAPQTAPTQTETGQVDVGGMFTTTDGDAARYERYRDLRDGAYTNLKFGRETGSYLFDATASHIGYRDQRYTVEYTRPRLTFGFTWIGLPLNYSYLTRTPYVTNGTTLTLPDSAQAAVQGPTNATNDGTAVGVPCAPGAPPATCGTVAQAAQAKLNRSIYDSLALPFDLRQKRNTAGFAAKYALTSAVDLDAKFSASMRDGQQPWNASFAFNNAVELPLPIDRLGRLLVHQSQPGTGLGQPDPDHRFQQREHRLQLPRNGSQRPMGLQWLQQRQRPGAGTRGARSQQHDERGQRRGDVQAGGADDH